MEPKLVSWSSLFCPTSKSKSQRHSVEFYICQQQILSFAKLKLGSILYFCFKMTEIPIVAALKVLPLYSVFTSFIYSLCFHHFPVGQFQFVTSTDAVCLHLVYAVIMFSCTSAFTLQSAKPLFRNCYLLLEVWSQSGSQFCGRSEGVSCRFCVV